MKMASMDIGSTRHPPHGMQTGSLKDDKQIEHWVMMTAERALVLPLRPSLSTVAESGRPKREVRACHQFINT